MNVLGEGGEFELLVVDCPFYKRRIIFDELQTRELPDKTIVMEVLNFETKYKKIDVFNFYSCF